MNLENFSHGFDNLLNSYNNANQNVNVPDIRVDEWEKSVFLTEAQEQEVLALYNGKNVYGDSFEKTEELRRYLATLVKEAELTPIDNLDRGTFDETYDDTFQIYGKLFLGMETNSVFFKLPENLWFITYECVNVTGGQCEGMKQDVYPVRQDEYHKIKRNPFRGANDRRALRLDLSRGGIEVISKYTVTSYYVRYLRKLKPIVLTDFDDEVSVNGVSEATECELPEFLHQRILERAVLLALSKKGLKIENNNENR